MIQTPRILAFGFDSAHLIDQMSVTVEKNQRVDAKCQQEADKKSQPFAQLVTENQQTQCGAKKKKPSFE
jgi:hypothetical protein